MGNLALKQTIWYLIGIVLVIIIYKLGNNYIYEHTNLLYVIGNLSLLLLLIFGSEVNGSKCWFVLPGIGSLQPSEFVKIFIMIELAFLIHNFRIKHKKPSLKQEFIFIVQSLVILLIPSILTFLEPDTGAVIVYFVIYLFMMFTSGIRFRWFIIGFILFALMIGSVLYLYFYQQDLLVKVFGSSMFYRLERIFDWQSGDGLQFNNSIVSIGSSGLFGYGIKNAPLYFPEAATDFIFSIYATTFGFIGVIILLTILFFLDYEIIKLSRKRIIDTDKFILSGILGMLLFQQVQNIGMTIGLLPITGITLPFISYGGSSLLSYTILVGLLINISKDKERKYTYK
jgi:rod shape determining protein RodA